MNNYVFKRFLLVLALFILGAFLVVPAPFCATIDNLSFTNLTEEVGRGFGDTWNRYAWSMEEFGGNVYVGTWNVNLDIEGIVNAVSSGSLDLSNTDDPLTLMYSFMKSTGGEIWRCDGSNNWQQVYDADDNEVGFRKMVEYNGSIYAGSVNGDGTNIYCSSSGDAGTWDPLSGGPMGNPNNTSIRAMIVHDENLLVGTENNVTGGELWAYDGSGWCQIGAGEFDGDPSVAEIVVYNNDVYVGTWDFNDKFKLFRVSEATDNGAVLQVDPVTPAPNVPGYSELSNLGVMQLKVYDGKLILGTVNYENGFTLMCTTDPTDTSSWNVITMDGLGDPSNAYSWSMQEWNDTLYMGTFNDGLYGGIYDPIPIPLDGRAQLWCSTDGTNWSQVVNDGFGSPFNYGFRTMTVADSRLIVGTASNMMIPEPSTLIPYLDTLLGNIDGVDIDALSAHLASISTDNWIGAEVWAVEHGSQAPVPEPATILLLGIGLAGLAKFRNRFSKE